MPVPEIVNVTFSPPIVHAGAPGLKTIPLTSVLAVRRARATNWSVDPNVATSAAPFGTVAGVQFAASCQPPLVPVERQVAVPAKAVWLLNMNVASAAMQVVRMRGKFISSSFEDAAIRAQA